MRTRLQTLVTLGLVPLILALLSGCSGTDDPPTVCGPGTSLVGGQCVSQLSCGAGTTLSSGQCVPTGGPICGEGTRAYDGSCIPAVGEICGDGTIEANGMCVPESTLTCGAGTEEVDGDCVPTVPLECGPGTTLAEDAVDGVFYCDPNCDAPEVWDETGEACVSECGLGTVFSDTSNTCVSECGANQYFATELETCVDLPECGINTAFDDGTRECVGYPWHELSLDTFCARRAFNVCRRFLDCCDNAGPPQRTFNGAFDVAVRAAFDALASDSEPEKRDLAYCLANEYYGCEMSEVALGNNVAIHAPDARREPAMAIEVPGEVALEPKIYTSAVGAFRGLRNAGYVTIDEDVLGDLDEYYVDTFDACTVDPDAKLWNAELFFDLFIGQLGVGEDCPYFFTCGEGLFCDHDRSDTCLTLVEEDESCYVTTFENIWGEYFSMDNCADGLDCIQGTCQAPIESQEVDCPVMQLHLYDAEPCREGLICVPQNGVDGIEDPARVLRCRAYFGDTAECPVPANGSGLDWCAEGLYCKDSAEGEVGDGVGRCASALEDGDGCDFCLERNLSTLDAVYESACDTGLGCTLVPNDDDGYDEVCAAEEDLCLFTWFPDELAEAAVCPQP